MPYKKEEEENLVAIFRQLEGRKAHEYAAATYRDVLDLQQLLDIIGTYSDEIQLADTAMLADSVTMLRYVAERYDSMGRAAISVPIYQHLLKLEAALVQAEPDKKGEFAEDFCSAIHARNYYVDDACEDLKAIAADVLSEEAQAKLIAENIRKSSIKKDAIEMTPKYLAVIDKVEQKIAENRKTDICHEYWSLKREYLAQEGVDWHSPAQLNPRVMFD